MRGAPLPDIAQTRRQLGFAVWTAATPITGAPAAYCFHIHHTEPRGLRGISDPIRHRCDQVLTIGSYHGSPRKACTASWQMTRKCRRGKGLINIFVGCERENPGLIYTDS